MSEQQNESPESEETEDTSEEQQSAEQDSSPQEDDQNTEDDWRKNFDPERARDKIRKQNSELKNLRDRAKTAEQKAEGVEEKDKRITAQEATILRYEVAFDLGLPKELATRLRGDTKEDMLADAEALLKLVGPSRGPASKRPAEQMSGGGDPGKEPEETDLDKLAAGMFRR